MRSGHLPFCWYFAWQLLRFRNHSHPSVGSTCPSRPFGGLPCSSRRGRCIARRIFFSRCSSLTDGFPAATKRVRVESFLLPLPHFNPKLRELSYDRRAEARDLARNCHSDGAKIAATT